MFKNMFKKIQPSLGTAIFFGLIMGFPSLSIAQEVPDTPQLEASPTDEPEVPFCQTGADCVDPDPCTQDHCENGACAHSPSGNPGCPEVPPIPDPPNSEDHGSEENLNE